MNKKLQISLYVVFDFISASAAWFLFFYFRKHFIETSKHGYEILVSSADENLRLGLIFIPLCWIFLYAFSGFYQHVFRRSRLNDLQQTFNTSLIGVLIIFFALILDDSVKQYSDYYLSFFTFFSLHFFTTLFFRLIITSRTAYFIQNRKWGFNTLIVGNGKNAEKLIDELNKEKKSEGFYLLGFIGENEEQKVIGNVNQIGTYNNISEIILNKKIQDVIICLDDEEHNKVPAIVDTIQNLNVHLKIMPDSYGIVMGMVKMNNILGAMLVEVDFEVMPYWQKSLKRSFDIFVSLVALLLLSPIFLIISIAIKLNSKGTVFFKQDRLGFKGKKFSIIKFRSMYMNAEKNGPQLSHTVDDRRTSVGIFLRKTRLDELPQFWNVLIGEMSIVGPRPEREFFIEKIIEKAPIYLRLHRIKPGITSWGQVKFGYASNIDEMVERMKYDILYLENMSIGLDIKILIYTALIVIQGRGK